MLTTPMSFRGMVTAPHHLAALAGRDVLREGGNAVEAMVTAAATVAVAYPHMNSIGGDGFWILHEPGQAPIGIDACGAAGAQVRIEMYTEQGMSQIPSRGPLAANTVAGAISGWQAALDAATRWGPTLGLQRLLAPAIELARDGIAVTASQRELTEHKRAELEQIPGFAGAFMPGGSTPAVGARFVQTRLADTLERLSQAGLDDFYRGDLAQSMAADLARVGAPISIEDLRAHRALRVDPLALRLGTATIYNMPPPTQGLASLLILGLFEQCNLQTSTGADYVHGLVEATKQAFIVRDRAIADPNAMRERPADLLHPNAIAELAQSIDLGRAAPWPHPGPPGDTVWMGAIDASGRAVSFIQSIYWEFGSGVVLEASGVQWQNRGSSFELDSAAMNSLHPGMRPFHTLNPALALHDDGRVMAYGTMGGEGQPQTQAAVYSRYMYQNMGLQSAVTAPRWLLGKTWGADSTSLKLESRFGPELISNLADRGHAVEVVAEYDSVMGHAGALVWHPDGHIEGATDPRSEGAVASL